MSRKFVVGQFAQVAACIPRSMFPWSCCSCAALPFWKRRIGRASLAVSGGCVLPVFVSCKVWSWWRMGRDQVLFAKVVIVQLCQGAGECLLVAFPVAATC